ncbi:DUF3099 domain-containing protein [Curtobacterium sp. ISL-83]|uniref:DUF3099 domain-containing protein n=1 Tax=Curtobacterium sp. ISL-83 TaxID=2819145 RepID=UPI001BEC5934|nr:DUF3099 domain-containing protein [Curtobacterium sp. ISL-83]MBT2503202.1 DUF3099 domain-containing protein [Curtobacterium sp. ISL-83]
MKTTHSITSLPDSPEQDRAHRLSRYVWQMAVRVVCFVGAVLVYTTWHTWLAVIPIVLAGVIPWVAVIVANAGSRAENDIVTPAGAVQLYDADDVRIREQQEDARAQAYRDEQDRLRDEAQHAQEEWQRHGDRSRLWKTR